MAAPAADIASAIDSLLERKARLHKAFSDLESKKAVLTKLGANWKDVDAYLVEVETRLRSTVEDFTSKEVALAAKMKDATEALDKRAANVASREESSLARVQEQKEAAVAAIRKLRAAKVASREESSLARVQEQKAKVASREESSLARVQEQKDAAVAVIRKLQSKLETSKEEEEDASKKEESSSEDDENATENASPDRISNVANASPPSQTADAVASPPSPHTLSLNTQLKSLCEAMEADKLRNFIAEHTRDLNTISAELPLALKLADDPAQLVLNALDGYSPSEGDESFLSNKRACVIMLEALAKVLADPVLGADHPIVSEDLKISAKEIADSWKSKIDLDGDLTANASIGAQSFLQLLATFGLAFEYNQDELCKLIWPIAGRKQTPSLCRSLGLSSKAPGMIHRLIVDGKQLEAITFATEFGILERFQPVKLLKAYLKDARRAAQNTLKGGNNTTEAQNDANQKELSALKIVLKAISDLNLQESYKYFRRLQKRVVQLEKAKPDRKRPAASGKPQQMKKPRLNNSGSGGSGMAHDKPRINNSGAGGSGMAHDKPQINNSGAGGSGMAHDKPQINNSGAGGSGMAHDKSYYRSDNRAQYGETLLPYGAATQGVYDRHSLGGYNTTYGGASRSPVSLQSSYMYPSDGLSSLGYGASTNTTTPSAAYSSYNYGTGLPPGYQSYH